MSYHDGMYIVIIISLIITNSRLEHNGQMMRGNPKLYINKTTTCILKQSIFIIIRIEVQSVLALKLNSYYILQPMVPSITVTR